MFYPGYLRALFLLRNCVFNPFIAPWVLLSSKMFYPGYFSLDNGLLLQQLLLMLLLIIRYFWAYFQIENVLLWVYYLRNLLQSTGQSGTFFDFTSKSEKIYRWSCFLIKNVPAVVFLLQKCSPFVSDHQTFAAFLKFTPRFGKWLPVFTWFILKNVLPGLFHIGRKGCSNCLMFYREYLSLERVHITLMPLLDLSFDFMINS